nr:mitotic-spindle organizing protein 1 [Drosophila suzukii]
MSENSQPRESEVTLTVLHAISEIVNTGLSKESLKICMELLEHGVSSLALAKAIKAIRKGVEKKKGEEEDSQSENADSGQPSPVTCRKLF